MTPRNLAPPVHLIVEGVIAVAIAAGLLALLLVTDRVAVRQAEARLARQFQDRGFAATPRVTIGGFPFLTQAAARRLTRVVISATGRRSGPLEVKRLDVILYGVSLGNGVTSADRLSGSALLGFAGIARIAGTPGLRVAADGADRLKITATLGPVAGTATARVTRASAGGIRVAVISAAGIPVAMLGSLRDLTLPLPFLPPGVAIQEVTVTGEGVLLGLTGQNASFSG